MRNIFESQDDGLDGARGIVFALISEAALVLIIVLILWATSAFAVVHPERWYQERFCAEVGGRMEVILKDRTRVDCLTTTRAWEVDFAHKWAESIGQSLHYARMTDRKPGIVLIIETAGDIRFIETLTNTIKTLNVDIELRLVRP